MIRGFIDPQAKLADVKALLDSFGVQVERGEKVLLRIPLPWIDFGFGVQNKVDWGARTTNEPIPAWPVVGNVPFDPDIRVKLIEWPWSSDESSWRRENVRWPFFVGYPLVLEFLVVGKPYRVSLDPGRQYLETEVL